MWETNLRVLTFKGSRVKYYNRDKCENYLGLVCYETTRCQRRHDDDDDDTTLKTEDGATLPPLIPSPTQTKKKRKRFHISSTSVPIQRIIAVSQI